MKKQNALWVGLLFFFSFTKCTNQKIDYVKSRYQHSMYGQDCLFYPAKNTKRLIVSFSGASKNRYSMWSWFWEETEDWGDTAYLFLKDDSFCWYLGNDDKDLVSDYTNIIRHFMGGCDITERDVLTVGRSMGGYAAIFYAVILGFRGAIVLNPMADKESAIASIPGATHTFGVLNTGKKWVDLNEVIDSCDRAPIISLSFGDFIRDKCAAYKLIDVLKAKHTDVILHGFPIDVHFDMSYPFNYRKEFIKCEIDYIESLEHAARKRMPAEMEMFDDDDMTEAID